MRRVIAAGCCCPRSVSLIVSALSTGATWIPTPGGDLGDHCEIVERIELVPDHEDDDLILITAHAPCPGNPDDAKVYKSVEDYIEILLHAGKCAVGIFLGMGGSIDLIDPGRKIDSQVQQIFYSASDKSKFCRGKMETDPKKILQINIAPCFEKEEVVHDGTTIHLSTIFPMAGAIGMIKAWGGGIFPPRRYSKRFQPHQVEALEAQFA